jgi:hypothetical protein
MNTQQSDSTTTPQQTAPKIHAAIMAVMSELDAIEKNRKNAGQNFMFRGVKEALAACHPLFIKHHMYIHPLKVSFHSMEPNRDGEGKARGTHVFQTITYRATSAEDGSFIDGEASGEAIDYQDKCSGKVMSISFKNFIFQLFCIPEERNESDPDEYTPNGPQGASDEQKGQAQQQQKSDPPKGAPAGQKTEQQKAMDGLVALLKVKGIKGAATVLKWASDQTKRPIKRLGEITEAEFAALKKTAEALPDANSDVKE